MRTLRVDIRGIGGLHPCVHAAVRLVVELISSGGQMKSGQLRLKLTTKHNVYDRTEVL
jgi:hypothetical protein